MAGNFANESMLDMYIFETNQQVERLEQLVIDGEKENDFADSTSKIHEIKEFLNLLKEGNGSDEYVKVIKENSQIFFVSSDKNKEEVSKEKYKACIYFSEDCGMENIRALELFTNPGAAKVNLSANLAQLVKKNIY